MAIRPKRQDLIDGHGDLKTRVTALETGAHPITPVDMSTGGFKTAWTNLVALNGWTFLNTPAWRLVSDILFLKGWIGPAGATLGQPAARLPVTALPAVSMEVPCLDYNGTLTTVVIDSAGYIRPSNAGVRLDSISIPAA